MRRLPLILGLLSILVLTLQDVCAFFITDQGIAYFSAQPRRVLYVVALGLVGGIVALMISRLSPNSQRRLKLASLGAFEACVTGVLCFLGFLITLAAPELTQAGLWAQVVVAVPSLLVVGAVVWWEFRQVWRQV